MNYRNVLPENRLQAFLSLTKLLSSGGTGGSNLRLWATNIPPGAVGPFTLTDTADGAVVSFDVDGYIWDTNTNTKINTFTRTFSATFDGETVASLFSDLPIDTPFSATFTATVIPTIPEPASMLLMGIGLFGVGVIKSRKARHSQQGPHVSKICRIDWGVTH